MSSKLLEELQLINFCKIQILIIKGYFLKFLFQFFIGNSLNKRNTILKARGVVNPSLSKFQPTQNLISTLLEHLTTGHHCPPSYIYR